MSGSQETQSDSDREDEISEITRTIDLGIVEGAKGVRLTKDTPPLVWAVDLIRDIKGAERNNASRTLFSLVKGNSHTH